MFSVADKLFGTGSVLCNLAVLPRQSLKTNAVQRPKRYRLRVRCRSKGVDGMLHNSTVLVMLLVLVLVMLVLVVRNNAAQQGLDVFQMVFWARINQQAQHTVANGVQPFNSNAKRRLPKDVESLYRSWVGFQDGFQGLYRRVVCNTKVQRG